MILERQGQGYRILEKQRDSCQSSSLTKTINLPFSNKTYVQQVLQAGLRQSLQKAEMTFAGWSEHLSATLADFAVRRDFMKFAITGTRTKLSRDSLDRQWGQHLDLW